LMAWACLPPLVQAEIRDEIERQLDRFETGLRFPPDHVDGHQHVHVLPTVRGALLDAVARRYGGRPPLVRDPTDRLSASSARSAARPKAILVGLLATGLARAADRRGLPVNDTFAGFSDFRAGSPYGEELAAALREPGRRHLVMCHPGHPDAELARLDTVVERRRMEYDALMGDVSLPSRIWRPSRKADGPSLAWPRLRD
jgi:chitin disaccharide deacetylase